MSVPAGEALREQESFAEMCVPDDGPAPDTVQVLIHTRITNIETKHYPAILDPKFAPDTCPHLLDRS